MLRHLLTRWANWIGDSSLDKAIRNELVAQGYPRQASRVHAAQLVAAQRPGWVQVWRFEVATSRDGQDIQLYGAARDDGRTGTRVVLSEDPATIERQLASWTEGHVVRRR